jgi:hypothetical protein
MFVMQTWRVVVLLLTLVTLGHSSPTFRFKDGGWNSTRWSSASWNSALWDTASWNSTFWNSGLSNSTSSPHQKRWEGLEYTPRPGHSRINERLCVAARRNYWPIKYRGDMINRLDMGVLQGEEGVRTVPQPCRIDYTSWFEPMWHHCVNWCLGPALSHGFEAANCQLEVDAVHKDDAKRHHNLVGVMGGITGPVTMEHLTGWKDGHYMDLTYTTNPTYPEASQLLSGPGQPDWANCNYVRWPWQLQSLQKHLGLGNFGDEPQARLEDMWSLTPGHRRSVWTNMITKKKLQRYYMNIRPTAWHPILETPYRWNH